MSRELPRHHTGKGRRETMVGTHPELSIVIPAMNEAENLRRLLRQTWGVIERLGCAAEIVVVVGPSTDSTASTANEGGARVVVQLSKGYGGALAEGFAVARGDWIL